MKLLNFESIIDHVKGFFSCKGRAKAGQKVGFRVMLKYFQIKKAFRHYIKQINSMLPCAWFSNRSQKTSKCGKSISDTLGYASCATYLFLLHFDVTCDLLLNRRTATWNLFVKQCCCCCQWMVVLFVWSSFLILYGWLSNCKIVWDNLIYWQQQFISVFPCKYMVLPNIVLEIMCIYIYILNRTTRHCLKSIHNEYKQL